MTPGGRRLAAVAAFFLGAGTTAAPAAGQAGAGTAAAAVLQIPAGGWAAGLGGAFTAGSGSDVLFYNPAGAAWEAGAAGAAHQRHVMGSAYTSAAAAARVRRVTVAVTFAALDFGSVEELVPDPAFGGQRGAETGRRAAASDVAARMALAVPLPGGRLAAGVSLGLFYSTLAESVRTAEVLDAGVHYRPADGLRLGAALRNVGRLTGAGLEPADLPTELRTGAAWTLPPFLPGGLVTQLHGDAVFPRYDAPNAIAAGLELLAPALPPVPGTGHQRLTGALRAGFNGAQGSRALGRLHYGAGLGLGNLALDYTFQPMGDLGATHRLGIRWVRQP
jgi:hypothetical protein